MGRCVVEGRTIYIPNGLPGEVEAIGLYASHDLLLVGFDACVAALGRNVDKNADKGLVDGLVPPRLGLARGGHGDGLVWCRKLGDCNGFACRW